MRWVPLELRTKFCFAGPGQYWGVGLPGKTSGPVCCRLHVQKNPCPILLVPSVARAASARPFIFRTLSNCCGQMLSHVVWAQLICQRRYRVECARSLATSEVERRRALLALEWGTAQEDRRVVSPVGVIFIMQPTSL